MPAPKSVKQPTDHKPKKAEEPDDRTITVRGVEVTIGAEVLDDFELLDDLGELENENAGRLPRILKRLTGDKYRTLLDAARDPETGRVSIEDGGALVQEILAALDPNS